MQGRSAHTPLEASDCHQLQSSRPTPGVRPAPWESASHQSGDCSARTPPHRVSASSQSGASSASSTPRMAQCFPRALAPIETREWPPVPASNRCVGVLVRFRQPRLLHRSSKACSSCVSAPPESLRVRNSESTEKSKPGSVSSRLSTYFQSMRSRTAEASCRSDNPSIYCITVTRARREARFGWLSAPWKKCCKHLLLVNAPQFIAHVHGAIPLRVRCSSHASGFFGHRGNLLRSH